MMLAATDGSDPALGAISIVRVKLLEAHPAEVTMRAIREVFRAQVTKERIIVNAQRVLVLVIPMAYGNAANYVGSSKGRSLDNRLLATDEAITI